ncbi:MAG: acyl carrier protein [Candidatus Binatia bacterium]
MKDHTSIRQRISTIVAEELQIDPPALEDNLIEEGLIDSMLFVSLLTRLEEEFDLTIALENIDLENFSSVAKITDFVLTISDVGA